MADVDTLALGILTGPRKRAQGLANAETPHLRDDTNDLRHLAKVAELADALA